MSALRILKPDTYKTRISDMWEGRGSSYDSSDTFHQALAIQLVQVADIQSGDTVLDVATGTGMVAIPIARLLGERGSVTGVDISESMLTEAKKKAESDKLTNCTFLRADAEVVEFQERSFDVILCSSGMLYLQDIGLALERFHSWLKPLGRLCFNTPQEPCVPATRVFYKVLEELTNIKLADAAAPLADTDTVRSACLSAGFESVKVEQTSESILFKNCGPEEYAEKIWRSVASNAFMTPLDGLLSDEVMDNDIKPIYLQRVVETAGSWVSSAGLENSYTMLWVTAEKGSTN